MAFVVESSVDIHAPIDTVWGILVDLDNYRDWNRFTPKVETTLAVGSPVLLHVQMTPKKMIRQKEWVQVVSPPAELSWGMTMGHPILLTATRSQTLTALDEQTTRYETVDKMSGLLVPLVRLLYGKHIKHGFDALVEGLRIRAESLV
ncbi:MAG: SRPBCC domain-containing protein [Proteobacteria bacterium]|nr:SRPBCC domain-containing protein [Pseudomonadota bacterium]